MIKRLEKGKLTVSKIKLSKLSPQKDDILVVSYNPHSITKVLATKIFAGIRKLLPDNKIIAVPKDVKITIEQKQALIERIKNL